MKKIDLSTIVDEQLEVELRNQNVIVTGDIEEMNDEYWKGKSIICMKNRFTDNDHWYIKSTRGTVPPEWKNISSRWCEIQRELSRGRLPDVLRNM
jgi:hypothetical protein